MSLVQITNLLSPLIYNGDVLLNGTVEFYEASTNNPLTVYVDAEGNGGAVVRTFESTGIIQAYVQSSDVTMKQVIKDSSGATLFTFDNLYFGKPDEGIDDKLSINGSSQMTGDLDLGTNDLINGGDLKIGANKTFLALHGGSPVAHPQDGLLVSEVDGYGSIRAGTTVSLHHAGQLVLSGTASSTNIPTSLIVNGVNIGSSISSIQSQLNTNDSNTTQLRNDVDGIFLQVDDPTTGLDTKVARAGDTMTGNLNLGGNVLTDVGSLDTVLLEITDGNSPIYYVNQEAGVFEISNSSAVRVLGITNAGQVNAGNGTAFLPSFSFINDPDTGMFLSDTNSLAFTTAGTRRLNINASGVVLLDAGTSLQLALGTAINEFSTDGTMGGNSDSAVPTEKAVKTFVESSTSSLDVSSKANIASPTFTGVVTIPIGSVGTPSLTFSGDTDSGLYSSGADQLSITTGGVRRGTFSSAGLQLSTGSTINEFSNDGTLAANSNAKVPTEQAVRTFISNSIPTIANLSAVGVNTDISTNNVTNTFSVTATGIHDSTKAARIKIQIVIEDTVSAEVNFDYYEIELTRPLGSNNWSFCSMGMPLAHPTLAVTMADRGSGTLTLPDTSDNVIDGFGSYTTTPYLNTLVGYVTTNQAIFKVQRLDTTPTNWTRQSVSIKAEVYG